jgi:hypothetical protein
MRHEELICGDLVVSPQMPNPITMGPAQFQTIWLGKARIGAKFRESDNNGSVTMAPQCRTEPRQGINWHNWSNQYGRWQLRRPLPIRRSYPSSGMAITSVILRRVENAKRYNKKA